MESEPVCWFINNKSNSCDFSNEPETDIVSKTLSAAVDVTDCIIKFEPDKYSFAPSSFVEVFEAVTFVSENLNCSCGCATCAMLPW